MEITTATLHQEADQLLARADWLTALRRLGEIVTLDPADDRARAKIGTALAALGRDWLAAAVFRASASTLEAHGFILSAIAALKDALKIDPEDPEVLASLARIHQSIAGLEAPTGKARVPPPTPPRAVPSDPGWSLLELVADSEELISKVGQLATAVVSTGSSPPATAVPLLGEVGKDAYLSLIKAMNHRRLPADTEIVKQGQPGSSLFMLIGGEVSVRRAFGERQIQVARMGAGSLFGEMALITAQPRSATVTTLQPSELFEIGREHVEAVAAQHPAFTDELVQFARRRMLRNLLASSPIFKPFEAQVRFEILKGFSSKMVPEGAVVIAEGSPGTALYLVASGEVQITKADKDGPVVLAHLHEGDVFGEISLIQDSPTTATAVATQKSVLLALDKVKFRGFTDAHPQAKAYLAGLSEERLKEIEAAMSSQMLDADELVMI